MNDQDHVWIPGDLISVSSLSGFRPTFDKENRLLRGAAIRIGSVDSSEFVPVISVACVNFSKRERVSAAYLVMSTAVGWMWTWPDVELIERPRLP